MPDGEPVVRFVGEQDLHVRIVRPERIAELAVGVAELVLGHDVERRAEPVRQILDVAAIDPEIAVRADADELPERRAVVARLLQGRCTV